MKRTIENKIRSNVILIYFVAVLLCAGISSFFYYNRDTIRERKENIEERDREIDRIKDLIESVNTAQKEVNLYISTKRISHLRAFQLNADGIKLRIDTLKIYRTDSLSINILNQLEVLLKQKVNTVFKLSTQFKDMDIPDEVKEQLKDFDFNPDSAGNEVDSFEIRKFNIRDTLIKAEPEKRFWKRLSGIFSADRQYRDTVITSFSEIIDTVRITSRKAVAPPPDVSGLVEKIKADYENRISSIEHQVIRLIMTDQDISSRISTILIDLYNNMIDSILAEIRESERKIQTDNTMITAGGLISLCLMLIFTVFTIINANRGLHMRISLEKSQARTNQLMESRHKLLLSVSHDIKTPVNSILGYLELKNSELTPHDRMSMSNSAKYILSLLNNLLEFSALEQGNLTVNASRFDLSGLCGEIREMFLPLARRKKLTFDCTFDFDRNLHVTSDLLKIKQIIINLLSNAVKYTTAGSIGFHVRFEQEKIHIRISDTGVGMPQSQTGKIFEPFTRFDENKNIAEGSGFGMYVVKGLSDLLGSTISIDSTAGKGTCIAIKIPAPAVPATGTAGTGAANKATAGKKSCSAQKIWIIDDDPTFLNLLKKMLVQSGKTVISSNTVSDFEEQKEQASSIDLVLTDMEVGSISGIDILHEIKKHHPDLPVFVMTGRDDFNQSEARKAGFDGYLPKPVTGDMLSGIMENFAKKEDRLASLREMLDNDEQAIRKILTSFRLSTMKDVELLQQYINENNFDKAQALCHKMTPMLLQTGMKKEAGFPKKMDSLRGKTSDHYPGWKTEGITFISEMKSVINELT
jgi:CheY-like chemotaxis protein/anti-sigma regulatory factor (Ser/Thr protein kinase)/CHASE3 domain sensor protein